MWLYGLLNSAQFFYRDSWNFLPPRPRRQWFLCSNVEHKTHVFILAGHDKNPRQTKLATISALSAVRRVAKLAHYVPESRRAGMKG
jgi:hypothetical protein